MPCASPSGDLKATYPEGSHRPANAIRDAGEHPTSEAMAELQRSKSKIQEQYEKIENCYTVILEMAEEEDYDRYEK